MALLRTPLYEEHLKLNGRMVDFGGWELPIQYTGVLDEHTACREKCGLFDVSHMGEVFVEGKDASNFLDYLLTNEISKSAIGQATYSAMCNEQGGIVDDLVVYRLENEKYLVVVNASNTDKDFSWMKKISEKYKNLKLTDESAKTGQIAIQGPLAESILKKITQDNISALQTYRFLQGKVLGIPAVIARTGYTGEDGFEIYVPTEKTAEVWRVLIEAGRPMGLKACGLGARDTLRLEMKYALYGHELLDTTNPLEAGLGWVTKLGKTDFVGKAALVKIKEQGLKRKLVGLKLIDRGIPRQGYAVFSSDSKTKIGELTSGTQSPTSKLPIGIGYVATEHSAIGTKVKLEIRGQMLDAEIIKTPFVTGTSLDKLKLKN